MEHLEDLIGDLEVRGRVCPVPMKWQELYRMLPGKIQNADGSWTPSLPLILAAWWDTSDQEKALRFTSHLEWANNNNTLGKVMEYLACLDEKDWHHLGE